MQSNNAAKSTKTTAKTALAETQEPEVHFDFHDELRNIHVTVPDATEEKTIDKKSLMLVQMPTLTSQARDPEAPVEKKMDKPVSSYVLQVAPLMML